MPNWCDNNVTLKHKDSAMIKRAYDAFGRNEFLNEFIPVPQDLLNTISGSYGDPEKTEGTDCKGECESDEIWLLYLV